MLNLNIHVLISCCVYNSNHLKLTAVEVVIHVATKAKSVPEEYNTFLHKLNFRPASILHRIDTLSYAMQFVR
jgi:hypothetical protein